MKVCAYYRYGRPTDVMALEDRPIPVPGPGEVLIRNRAVGLNGSDCEITTAYPAYSRIFGALKPRHNVLGSDVAGVVTKLGDGVTNFTVGDQVFGDIFELFGGFAEYTVAPADKLLPIPDKMDFVTAATLPQSGTNALQPVIYDAKVSAGQKVLILGACGGAGVFAVQMAKAAGAEVTAVDRGAKLDLAHKVGADHVLDFETEDVLAIDAKFDLILDYFATRPFYAYRHMMTPTGLYMFFGGQIRPLYLLLSLGWFMSRKEGQSYKLEAVSQSTEKLAHIAKLVLSGQLTPVVAETLSLEELPDALDRMSRGEIFGKAVVVFPED